MGGRKAQLPGEQALPFLGTGREGHYVYIKTGEVCYETDEVSKHFKTECPELYTSLAVSSQFSGVRALRCETEFREEICNRSILITNEEITGQLFSDYW